MAAHWLPAGRELIAFADNDPARQGALAGDGLSNSLFPGGIPVIHPAQIPALAPDLVWITVLNRDAARKIEGQLRELGYRGEIRTLEPFRDLMDLRLAHTRLFAEEIRDSGFPGAVAELGVYRGDFAAEINRLFPDRTLCLFDTFTGFPPEDMAAESRLASAGRESRGMEASFRDFGDTGVELVRSRLPHPEKAVFYKGRFPETLPEDLPPLVFVSLDPDLYAPALAGLRAFWPKLVPGGQILIHDYNSAQFTGVKKAVQLFCTEQGLSVLPLADLHGSAVLMKQK